MQQDTSSKSALVSAFLRAYHAENSKVKIFNDSVAKQLLTEDEYRETEIALAKSARYFEPNFEGSEKDAVTYVVNKQIGPPALGRAAFTEEKLELAVQSGAEQYLILAAGFDSFGYRQPEYAKGIHIFELDHKATSRDKQERVKRFCPHAIENLHYVSVDFTNSKWEEALLAHKNYDKTLISFCSILGIAYYLSKADFEKLIWKITQIVAVGSSIVFDYPVQDRADEKESESIDKQRKLAKEVNETMLAEYSFSEMEELLQKYGFCIKEHLVGEQITNIFFSAYNKTEPKYPIIASKGINYCYAQLEKKR